MVRAVPTGGRRRHLRRGGAVVAAFTVLLILASGCSPADNEPQGNPSGASTPDGTWTVAAGDATVKIEQVEFPGDAADGLTVGTEPVEINLADGAMPAEGIELELLLEKALPESAIAALARWNVDARQWEVVPSLLADDRRTISATVDHLSTWSWVSGTADQVTAALGKLIGTRTEPPTCEGNLPSWADEVAVFDEANSPLRWCAGHDREHPEVLVVKVANNRGYGMGVHTAAVPQWSYSSVFDAPVGGSLSSLAAATVREVSAKLTNGILAAGDPLPPREEMHYGFTEDVVEKAGTAPLLRVESTAVQILAGVTYIGLDTLGTTILPPAAMAGAILSAVECAASTEEFLREQRWDQAANAAMVCISASAGVLASAGTAMVLAVDPTADPKLVGGSMGRVLGKIWQVWAAREAFKLGWTVGEIRSDLEFDPSAFEARVLLTPRRPALDGLLLSNGGLGGLRTGADPSRAAARAKIVRWDPQRCAEFDIEPGGWVANYPSITGIWGNEQAPFSLDVADGKVTRIDLWTDGPRTAEGIGVGSTLAELQDAYGDNVTQGGEAGLSQVWLLQQSAGTLAFEIAQPIGDGYWPDSIAGTVVAARILEPGYPNPEAPTAGSDDVAGGC